MAASLLAHLYTHIKGSQEDVATLSLQYIVSQTTALNRVFTKILCKSMHIEDSDELTYVCQSVGENLERPDIAGVDTNGKEKILCEAKFYAGLTDNQPNAYLDRLKKNKAYGLVFICPTARKVSLWNALIDLVRERTSKQIDAFCVSVDGIRMSIITWHEIIESLRITASSEAVGVLPDIFQLEGYCQLVDSKAFIPLAPEDLGPDVAQKEERYFQILDELIEYLRLDRTLQPSTKGVKATAYRQGYGRGIKIRGYWLSINYDRELWMSTSSCETPFWVAIRSGLDWKQHDYILQAFQRFPATEKDTKWNMTYLALHPVIYGTLEETVSSMKQQLMEYIDIIEKVKHESDMQEESNS